MNNPKLFQRRKSNHKSLNLNKNSFNDNIFNSDNKCNNVENKKPKKVVFCSPLQSTHISKKVSAKSMTKNISLLNQDNKRINNYIKTESNEYHHYYIKPQLNISKNLTPKYNNNVHSHNNSNNINQSKEDSLRSNFMLNYKRNLLEYTFYNLGIDKVYLDILYSNKIEFEDLLLLTKEDLKEMNIPIGPRNRILLFVNKYTSYKNTIPLNYTNINNINSSIEILNEFFKVYNQSQQHSQVPTNYNNVLQHPQQKQQLKLRSSLSGLSQDNNNQIKQMQNLSPQHKEKVEIINTYNNTDNCGYEQNTYYHNSQNGGNENLNQIILGNGNNHYRNKKVLNNTNNNNNTNKVKTINFGTFPNKNGNDLEDNYYGNTFHENDVNKYNLSSNPKRRYESGRNHRRVNSKLLLEEDYDELMKTKERLKQQLDKCKKSISQKKQVI